MKRNTALFGASLVVGVATAAGMVATSTTSSAAVNLYGAAWETTTDSAGWRTGAVADGDGIFTATAARGSVQNFAMPSVGVSGIGVTSACVNGKVVTTVSGGSAAGVHQPGTSVSAAAFTGNPNVIGTVYFGSRTVGGATVGAYFDLTSAGLGNYIALTGVSGCVSATGTSTGTTTQTTTGTGTVSPTSTSTGTSTSTSTGTGTSTPTGTSTGTSTPTGTSTGTSTPTGTSTSSPTSTSTGTGPVTPPPTTTTMPVTG